MLSKRRLSVFAALVIAVWPASAASEDQQESPPAPIVTDLSVDLHALRQYLTAQAPFALWWDAAFASQRQAIAANLALAFRRVGHYDDPRVLPLPLLWQAQTLRWRLGVLAVDRESFTYEVHGLLELGLAETIESYQEQLQKLEELLEPMQLAGFDGFGSESYYFAGRQDRRYVAGDPALITLAEAAAAEEPRPAGIGWLQIDGGALQSLAQEISAFIPDEQAADAPVEPSSLLLHTASDGNSQAQIRGAAAALLKKADTDLAARLPAEADLHLLAHCDLTKLHEIFTELFGTVPSNVEELRQLVHSTIFKDANDHWAAYPAHFSEPSIDEEPTAIPLADRFTGSVGLALDWSGAGQPWPSGRVLARCQQPASLLQELIGDLATEELSVAGFDRALRLPLPEYPERSIFLGCFADLLVAASSEVELLAALAPRPQTGDGAQVQLRVRCQRLLEALYPALYAWSQAWPGVTFGRSPYKPLENYLYNFDDSLTAPAGLAQPNTNSNSSSSALVLAAAEDWEDDFFQQLLPPGEDAAAIDAGVSLWRSELTPPRLGQSAMLLAHEGSFVVVDQNGDRQGTLAEVEDYLQNYQRLAGPAPTNMRPLPEVPRARFNSSWLPAPELVAQYPWPEYHLSLRGSEELQLQEQGLPLVTSLAFALAPNIRDRLVSLQATLIGTRYQARYAAAETRHAATLTVLRQLAPKLPALHQAGTLPASATGLLSAGHLRPADLAALFAGTPPSDPAALEQLGHWQPQPDPDAYPSYFWAIRLDEEWIAAIDTEGEVEMYDFSDSFPDLPAAPAPAAPASGDDESLF